MSGFQDGHWSMADITAKRLGGVAGDGAGVVASFGHEGQERVQAVRVEVAAAPGLQVAQGPVGWPGRTVGAVGGECVPDVDHGDDAGGQRDLLGGEAVGVSLPSKCSWCWRMTARASRSEGGPADDVGADHRVLLDPGPLLLGQGAGLVQDVVGIPTLPTSCR
jgi:hypothetical protein